MPHGNHQRNGVSGNGHLIDGAFLELDEPTPYHLPPDPTPCFQHAAKHPQSWRSMSQEARLLAAMTAWEPFEAHQRASPDDSDGIAVLRLAWNDPPCRDYLHGQFRNTRQLDSFAERLSCVAVEPFLDPSLCPDDIESRAFTWLMGRSLAKGVVTGPVGLPSAGKSTFACRVVAALTRGLALPSLLPEGLHRMTSPLDPTSASSPIW